MQTLSDIQDFFLLYPYGLIAGCALLGLVFGSFINLVIYRFPIMLQRQWRDNCLEYLNQPIPAAEKNPLNLMLPRSHCPSCLHTLRWWENIPLLSYVALRGRCHACHEKISLEYPFVEILAAAMLTLLGIYLGWSWTLLWGSVFSLYLLCLAMIDLKHQILPDDMTLPLLWLGLFVNIFNQFSSAHDAIIGALVGYLSLWSIAQAFKLITGRVGMGHGDFKLLALLGAWLGWQLLPFVILTSSVLASIVGVLLLVRGRAHQEPIPFGPYLAFAGFIALIWGNTLTEMYLRSIL